MRVEHDGRHRQCVTLKPLVFFYGHIGYLANFRDAPEYGLHPDRARLVMRSDDRAMLHRDIIS